MSSVLKAPVLFLCFFMRFGGSWLLKFVTVLGFLILGLLFWVYSISWEGCWCHMMLSSRARFIVMSVVISLERVFGLFCVYFVWASLVIWFFWQLGTCDWGLGR